MGHLLFCLLSLLMTIINIVYSQSGFCMKGRLHKTLPGPESELFSQCTPWKERSCCTYNTTRSLHEPSTHIFNVDHCRSTKPMSPGCHRHFVKDLCFYECSPNIGHWLVEAKRKISSQRFYKVPLCLDDCNRWFDACRNDFTCSTNWYYGFTWNNGTNECQTDCLTFEAVFKNATNFCKNVWDGSWTVAEKEKPCMTMWFDGQNGNPNDHVAMFYSQMWNSASSSFRTPVMLLMCIVSSMSLVLFKIGS